MTNTYAFSNDTPSGILLPQRIRKSDLAFFYGVTPRQFRRELSEVTYCTPYKHYYSLNEVEKIFKCFGPVSRADVENAKTAIEKYLSCKKQENLQY
jgi:hypothetical protein